MNINMRLIVFILLLIAPSLSWAEKYLCIAEDASGFIYRDVIKKWENTAINPQATKYLVSFTDRTVSKFGEEDYEHEECYFFFIESKKVFYCNDGFGEFQMGEKSMKYLRTSPYYDYVMGETSSTPHIEIGTCSKF